jgi:hypothetical protein
MLKEKTNKLMRERTDHYASEYAKNEKVPFEEARSVVNPHMYTYTRPETQEGREPASAPAPSQSSFNEGQVIKNKTTGQLFVIKNGVPVPKE